LIPAAMLARRFSAVEDSDIELQLSLLKQASIKLTQARECRHRAAIIGDKEATSMLVALAADLEQAAYELSLRAERLG